VDNGGEAGVLVHQAANKAHAIKRLWSWHFLPQVKVALLLKENSFNAFNIME